MILEFSEQDVGISLQNQTKMHISQRHLRQLAQVRDQIAQKISPCNQMIKSQKYQGIIYGTKCMFFTQHLERLVRLEV